MNSLEAHASARTRQQAITEAANAVENVTRDFGRLIESAGWDRAARTAVFALRDLAHWTGDKRSVAECDAFLAGVSS